MLTFTLLRLYSYHKGFVKILLQTLVAILGVVSRKSPFRSMLSSSLIGELRASFVVPINEYCLLVIYMFCSQPPAVSPFMLFDIFPLRPPLGTFCPKVCLKAALKQFTTWTKYTEELYYCTKSLEFWFIWLVDLQIVSIEFNTWNAACKVDQCVWQIPTVKGSVAPMKPK